MTTFYHFYHLLLGLFQQKQNKDKHIKQGQNTLDTPEGDDYILPLLPFIAGVVPTIIEQGQTHQTRTEHPGHTRRR